MSTLVIAGGSLLVLSLMLGIVNLALSVCDWWTNSDAWALGWVTIMVAAAGGPMLGAPLGVLLAGVSW